MLCHRQLAIPSVTSPFDPSGILSLLSRRIPFNNRCTSSLVTLRCAISEPANRHSNLSARRLAMDPSRQSSARLKEADPAEDSSSMSLDAVVPDTEDNVVTQTDSVFRSFVYHMYTNDVQLQDQPTSTVDELHDEMKQIAEESPMPNVQIGRQLALIGDDINERYSTHFNQMIRALNPAPETAYEVFAGVARKLFHDGNINWGRVVTLLCFGYRLTVSVMQRGHAGFFASIARFVVHFVLVENIAKWIADQGGWRAIMTYIPESIGWKTIGVIFAISALSIATAVFFARKP